MKFVVLLVITLFVCASADNWAVLVAGSNGYGNYRHQSDVCHAYQILVKHGVNPAKIINMSYDDIANNRSNPFPGKVFNKPTGANPGVDVYAGCKINYKGNDVTPKNYLAILQGQKDQVHGGDGKVLESNSNDNIFLNYSDHGSVGLVAFPAGGYLYADQLIAALKVMGDKKMYHWVMYYLEACESGSMFVKLPKNTNIYAATASNPTEPSWGWYCYPDDIIQGKHIGSCLGDEFSVRWMEDTDEADVTTKTVLTQFNDIKKKTVKSHVTAYGDMGFQSQVIGQFFGMKKNPGMFGRLMRYFESDLPSVAENNRLAEQNYLVRKFQQEPNEENYYELYVELEQTRKFNSFFTKVSAEFNLSGVVSDTTDFDCYRYSIDMVESKCGKANSASLGQFKYLYELCQKDSFIANENLRTMEDFEC